MLYCRAGPSKLPLAELELPALMALLMESSDRPMLASACRLPCTRTAGRWPPASVTRPTPSIWLIFSASRVLTMFCTSVSGRLSEVMASCRMGASAGLILAYTGGAGRSAGSSEPAAFMAAWTSCSAESMDRLRLNCSVISDTPALLTLPMRARPGIWPNWRSSGAVTVRLITSGLPPGYSVCT